jgi:PHD/YefM family antitoxin component YafN of YafNO toxin-antitoxin module
MMNLAKDLVEISQASLPDLSAEVHEKGPKLVTKDGVGDLVVLAVEDYEEMVESLEVAAGLLRGEADLAAGRTRSNADVQELLRARIASAAQPGGKAK